MSRISASYDGPGNNNYSAMYHSSGQKTDIYQNVWGETERVQQWGTQNGYTVDQSQYNYYDTNRRLCRQHVLEGGDTVYSYDAAAGQMTAYQKGLSTGTLCSTPTGTAKVSLGYDLLGRLTTTDFSDTGTSDITRSYDVDGNALTVNRSGVNWTYAYNELSLLTSETLELDSLSYPISYLYNTSGHMTRKTLPTMRQINYTPDGLGRPTTIKDGAATLASNTTYHPSGSVSNMTYGNGQTLVQTLDARLLPLRIHSYEGSQTAIDQTFSYDVRANLTGLVDGAVSGNNRTNGYDTLNRITSASGPWGSGSYTYDALGNLRQKVLGSRSVNLSYDSSNRLSQSVDTGPSGTRTVAYDTRGNVTTLGGLTFVYDYADQPVSLSGTASGTYSYDGNLKRVKAVVNGKTIYNVFDASGSLVHVDKATDGKTTDYVSGPNGALARIENNVVTYLHPDVLGSAQSGTNSAGTVLWREQYTPFGEEWQGQAANDDQSGYTGHIKDSATGLNYMQARYYDPVIGRFMAVDPVGFTTGNAMSFNRYLYVNNNPFRYTDPDGRIPCPNCVTAAIGAGVGFLSGVITSTYSELTDEKEGVSLTNIVKSTVKSTIIGGVTGFSGPAAGVATAAALGGADAAITTADGGGSVSEILASGAAGAAVEAGSTFIGGQVGAKVGGSILKSEAAGNAATAASAAVGNAVFNQVPGVVDAVSKTIRDSGQDISDGVGRFMENLQRPMIDLEDQ